MATIRLATDLCANFVRHGYEVRFCETPRGGFFYLLTPFLPFCETILGMQYESIRYHSHARKRMRRRKISRAQVECTLQNPDRSYESWGKLAVEGATAEGNTIFVYYVESGPGEALVLSVKRRRGTPEGGRREP